ncbi:MAG: hypothetical protein V4576_01710 [Patescibacteria group bacterium]
MIKYLIFIVDPFASPEINLTLRDLCLGADAAHVVTDAANVEQIFTDKYKDVTDVLLFTGALHGNLRVTITFVSKVRDTFPTVRAFFYASAAARNPHEIFNGYVNRDSYRGLMTQINRFMTVGA